MSSNYLKKLFFVFVVIIACIAAGCTNNDKEERGKEGWDYDSIIIDSSCSMYIEYHDGKGFFKVSTIDWCPNLDAMKYIEGYKELLNNYSDKLLSNKGIAIFETPFILVNDTMFTNKLIDITNVKFNAICKVIEKKKTEFIIDVKPKQ